MALSVLDEKEATNKSEKTSEELAYQGHKAGDVNEVLLRSPVQIIKPLLLITTSLLACHLIVVHLGIKILDLFHQSSSFPFYQKAYYSFYRQFHLALEGNIPTYFSTLLLVIAAILLYVIHSTGKKDTLHWLYLSLVFLFLSIDELAELHETFGGLVGNELNSNMDEVPTYLRWAWMVPYAVLTLFIGLYFLKFTLNLPPKTRNLFFLSGIVYVFAALGLEFFEAHFDTVYGPENLVNQFLFPLEEIMEMLGVIIFIYALLDYMMLKGKVLQIYLTYKK